jgi:hypothetical protein
MGKLQPIANVQILKEPTSTSELCMVKPSGLVRLTLHLSHYYDLPYINTISLTNDYMDYFLTSTSLSFDLFRI